MKIDNDKVVITTTAFKNLEMDMSHEMNFYDATHSNCSRVEHEVHVLKKTISKLLLLLDSAIIPEDNHNE